LAEYKPYLKDVKTKIQIFIFIFPHNLPIEPAVTFALRFSAKFSPFIIKNTMRLYKTKYFLKYAADENQRGIFFGCTDALCFPNPN
jgi:hypothetical protein